MMTMDTLMSTNSPMVKLFVYLKAKPQLSILTATQLILVFLPFDKYANQKRPTTGKLVAKLDWDDPEAEAERDADLCNAMYDQTGGIFGY